MANARPGGPRRPGLDYYEYKRLHEQHQKQDHPSTRSAKPAVQPVMPAPTRLKTQAAPEPKQTLPSLTGDELDFSENALDLPVDLEFPDGKSKRFSGVKALMKGVSRRVPEDEPELSQELEEPKGFTPVPVELEDDEDDDQAGADDAPQIDNPIGDAFLKVKGLFQKARGRLAERRLAQPGEDSGEQDSEEEEQTASAAESSVSSRRMRKAIKSSEPPILTIEPVDVQEVDALVAKPGTTVRAGFMEDQPPEPAAPMFAPEDEAIDDDDDDLPTARGTRMFGFFKKMRGHTERAAEETDAGTAQTVSEDQLAGERVKAEMTQLLAEDAGGPTLSRKERKALAAGKPVAAAPALPIAPAAPEKPAATMPFTAPTALKTTYPVDEPTMQFRPVRPQHSKIVNASPLRPIEPEIEDFDEDADSDLPVRRASKPPREKKRRVYQDEDLEDEEYDRADRGNHADRYDEYDEEEYDDYDDYDEDDERYEDEYHVSGGRRFLGFLKGLAVFILLLAMCILALRQLEASRLISLGGLRSAVGQLSLILPSPAPEVTAEPTLAPTALPTPEPTAVPTVAPDETPGADITQVEPTADSSIPS